jgi:hypothetical protein
MRNLTAATGNHNGSRIPQNQGRKFGERLAQTAADSSFPSAAGAGTPWLLIDSHSLAVSRYWQELFDLDEFKSEIQSGWQPEGSDLLAISSIQILERFEGQGIVWRFLGARLTSSVAAAISLPAGRRRSKTLWILQLLVRNRGSRRPTCPIRARMCLC